MIQAIFSMPLYITMPIILIGYSTACLGTGISFLKLFGAFVEQISVAIIVATGFILGEEILASLWLLLALADWFSAEVVGTVYFLFIVLGLYNGLKIFSSLKNQTASTWYKLHDDTWRSQLLAGLTVILCLSWITSLGELIASAHRLIPLPGYEELTNIGLQGELHFAALRALHSPEAANLFSWPTITTAGVMLTSLGRVVGMGRRGQWLTLGMLFLSSAVVALSGDGEVDLFAVALGLAAYYWAVQIRFMRTRAVLLLTGLFKRMVYFIVIRFRLLLLVVLDGLDRRINASFRGTLPRFGSSARMSQVGAQIQYKAPICV